MPKPINLRGFETNGEYQRFNVSYKIDPQGLESICITCKDGSGQAILFYDCGELKQFHLSTPQVEAGHSYSPRDEEENYLFEFSPEIVTLNKNQGELLYKKIYRELKIDERLKAYVPRFSVGSELSLFNILGIEDTRDLIK
jgi:hypothetical protein